MATLCRSKAEFKGLTDLEIVAAGKLADIPEASSHTFNSHQRRLTVFFKSLIEMKVIECSPLDGVGPLIDISTDPKTGRAFKDEELIAMFDEGNFTRWARRHPHRWWGTMLGLYTGARIGEIAQLKIDDVAQINGHWCLIFRTTVDDSEVSGSTALRTRQRIKCKSSIRQVPLAQPLLDAGFLDFVKDMEETKHARLFPLLPSGMSRAGLPNGTGYGHSLGQQFRVYARRFGMEKGVAFHAFRHTMATRLADAGVDHKVIAKITGHSQAIIAPGLRHYVHTSDAKDLEARIAALARFDPPIKLPAYSSGQFQRQLSRPKGFYP